jgi:putative SOS response-associated peptidase YedK
MRWGLIPWWWKKPLKQLPASFNARAETVADKPMFRDAFARHRCIIPASGYYEWLKRPDGRQPYFISAADGNVLSFAGLWDRWKNPETGETLISCTIIVTDANALTRPIHDRMPVVLDRADIGAWLSGAAGVQLLRPAAEDRLRMWPVSRRVNKTGTGDDDPTLLAEVTAR